MISRPNRSARMLGLGRKKKPDKAGKPGDDGVENIKIADPSEIIPLCDEILETAFERNASDIHIDPEENIVLVQLRVDGIARNAPQAAEDSPQRR